MAKPFWFRLFYCSNRAISIPFSRGAVRSFARKGEGRGIYHIDLGTGA